MIGQLSPSGQRTYDKSLFSCLFISILMGVGVAFISLNLLQLPTQIMILLVVVEALIWGIGWLVTTRWEHYHYPGWMSFLFGLLGIGDHVLIGIFVLYSGINLAGLLVLVAWSLLTLVLTLMAGSSNSNQSAPKTIGGIVAAASIGATLVMAAPATLEVVNSGLNGPTYLSIQNYCRAPLTIGPLNVFGQKLAGSITVAPDGTPQKIETPPVSIHLSQTDKNLSIQTALDGEADFAFLGQINTLSVTYNGVPVTFPFTARLSDRHLNEMVVSCQ